MTITETTAPYDYSGPDALQAHIEAALRRVVDPEVALNIVDVGLVYGVTVTSDRLRVLVTMTSAACPVVDVILEDIEHQLDDVAPEGMGIEVELVWSPVWTPERISARAREFMGW